MSFHIVKPLEINFEQAAGEALAETLEAQAKPLITNHFGSNQPDWAPLKPSTVMQRREVLKHGASGFGPSGPIMHRTGRLQKAVTANPVKVETNNGKSIGAIWTTDLVALALNKSRKIYIFSQGEKRAVFSALAKAFINRLKSKS